MGENVRENGSSMCKGIEMKESIGYEFNSNVGEVEGRYYIEFFILCFFEFLSCYFNNQYGKLIRSLGMIVGKEINQKFMVRIQVRNNESLKYRYFSRKIGK